MLKIYMDVSEYLAERGINLPMGIFWFLLIITIIVFCIVGYKKCLKPIFKDIKNIEDKINKIDEIDKIKDEQDKSNKKSIEADKKFADELLEINNKMDNFYKMFINKQINDMRYDILDFGSALMNGRRYEKESYDHILEIYNEYEKILKENNMTNGRVDTTMEIIKESYKNKFSVVNNN